MYWKVSKGTIGGLTTLLIYSAAAQLLRRKRHAIKREFLSSCKNFIWTEMSVKVHSDTHVHVCIYYKVKNMRGRLSVFEMSCFFHLCRSDYSRDHTWSVSPVSEGWTTARSDGWCTPQSWLKQPHTTGGGHINTLVMVYPLAAYPLFGLLRYVYSSVL